MLLGVLVMRKQIVVTQEDIDKAEGRGARGDSEHCVLAVALNRAGYGPTAVGIWKVWIRNTSDHNNNSGIEMPEDMQNYARDFDMGRPVEPTSFWIEVPD